MNPITLNIELDLTTYLREHRGFGITRDSSGAPCEPGDEITGPVTLEDIVLGLAAREVYAAIDNDARRDLALAVRNTRAEVIREQIAPLVAEALDGTIQQTNIYGEATGKSSTLREMVMAEITTYLTSKKGRSRDVQTTAVEDLVAAAVKDVVGAELREAVDAAKAEVKAAITHAGAEVITETVQKLAAGR